MGLGSTDLVLVGNCFVARTGLAMEIEFAHWERSFVGVGWGAAVVELMDWRLEGD